MVIHFGHILSINLDDSSDITMREIRHFLRKSNYTLCTFSFADPFIPVLAIEVILLVSVWLAVMEFTNKILNLQFGICELISYKDCSLC